MQFAPKTASILHAAIAAAWLLGAAAPAVAQHQQAMATVGHSMAAAPASPGSFAALMTDSMQTMDAGMRAAPMKGDPDHDFAAMMIPHHQGAIDMAKAQLLYGKNPVLRRLAQEIIVTQGSEIAVMQAELDRPTVQSDRSHPPLR